jgi:hypothetical protein
MTMPDISIAILRNRAGAIVDVEKIPSSDSWYANYNMEKLAKRMEDGDELTRIKRRLTDDDRTALAKEREDKLAKDAEAEAEAKRVNGVNKAAELRAAADKLEAGELTFSQVADQFVSEIPF